MSAVDPSRNPLMVSDLLYAILDCFRPAWHSDDSRTLAALARTCRAFSEPSLDHLWKELHSLEPLIRCYTDVDNVANPLPPTSSQSTVIDRYSHRIRELTVRDSPSLHFLQCVSMQRSCLLPNIVTLKWGPSASPPHIPIMFIRRLLNPTLTSIAASLAETDGATLLSFFDSLSDLCPNLKSLKLNFSVRPQSSTTIGALSRALCAQRTLEKVILNSEIDHLAVKYLSALPTLKMLCVRLSDISRPPTPSFLSTDSLFCSIERLQFQTSDLHLVMVLLRPRSQLFHTFSLYHDNRMTSKAAGALFDLLGSKSRTTPLRTVTLSSGDFLHPMSADQMATEASHYRLSFETFQPLSVFGSIRYLKIEWGDQISLDDNEVTKLARAWPSLEVLDFYCSRGGYAPFSTKYPTLRGLLSLVASCLELYTISLPLDATHVPAIDAEPQNTNFTWLTLPESPIGLAIPVAEFLFKHLPCVTMLDYRFVRDAGVPQIEAYEKAWEEAETHLRELHGL